MVIEPVEVKKKAEPTAMPWANTALGGERAVKVVVREEALILMVKVLHAAGP